MEAVCVGSDGDDIVTGQIQSFSPRLFFSIFFPCFFVLGCSWGNLRPLLPGEALENNLCVAVDAQIRDRGGVDRGGGGGGGAVGSRRAGGGQAAAGEQRRGAQRRACDSVHCGTGKV